MSADAEETVIAANGKVWLADTTDVMPTDSDTALDGAWVDLGFVSTEGVALEVGADQTALEAWNNGGYPVRRFVTARSAKLSFSLEQLNAVNLPFAFGGGTVTGGGGTNEVQVVGLTGFSGTDSFHITTQAPVTPAAESAVITRGTNFTAAGIKAAIEGIAGFTGTVDVADVTDEGFQVTFTGTYGLLNIGLMTVTTTSGVTGLAYTLVAGSAPGGAEYAYTPPGSDDPVPTRALLVEWADGTKNYRMLVPAGQVTNAPTTSLTRTDAMMLPIEFEATPASSAVDAYTIYTDDPAFA